MSESKREKFPTREELEELIRETLGDEVDGKEIIFPAYEHLEVYEDLLRDFLDKVVGIDLDDIWITDESELWLFIPIMEDLEKNPDLLDEPPDKDIDPELVRVPYGEDADEEFIQKKQALIKKTNDIYGVDISDIEDGKPLKIMRRISDAQKGKSGV